MERVNRILYHPAFRSALERLAALERQRPFCGHGIEHLLSVAQLAQLFNLEGQWGVDRELLCAAALLHDLGREEQYLHGVPHEEAGARLAEPILSDCGFTPGERQRICAAIAAHRSGWDDKSDPLAALLHRADHRSRPCYLCPASAQCNWPPERRNRGLD